MICAFGDLQQKEVINLCDGSRLGYLCDAEIDLCTGRIITLLLPGESRLLCLKKCPPLRIPWERVRQIGEDLILVELPVGVPATVC